MPERQSTVFELNKKTHTQIQRQRTVKHTTYLLLWTLNISAVTWRQFKNSPNVPLSQQPNPHKQLEWMECLYNWGDYKRFLAFCPSLVPNLDQSNGAKAASWQSQLWASFVQQIWAPATKTPHSLLWQHSHFPLHSRRARSPAWLPHDRWAQRTPTRWEIVTLHYWDKPHLNRHEIHSVATRQWHCSK